jgi:arylsulfatase A-like enzyme
MNRLTPHVLRMALAVTLLFLSGAAARVQSRPPNILLIVADDLGYADLGIHGCKDIPTPHIDSLATNGVRFTDGYVSGPYCSPTRAGLLTGRYQQRFGHEFNEGVARGDVRFGLPLSETTMANRLKAAGYTTGLLGKWHLGSAEPFHPMARGFDEFFGFLGGDHSYLDTAAHSRNPLLDGRKPVETTEYLTDVLGDRAVDYIRRHRSDPFFLYLAFNAVHTPMHATEKYLARFDKIADTQRRTYAAMLSAMDDAIGRTLAALREAKLEEHTVVVFLSDNGGPTMPTTTINGSVNTPLRGSKRQTFEGGIRVPFIMQWTSRLPAGRTYTRPVMQIDVLPTALAAAGVKAKPDWKLDGVDLLPFLTGEATGSPHEALYWRLGGMMAIRRGDWKLVKASEGPLREKDPAVLKDLSLAELYNLDEDIGEKNNLAAKHPDKVKALADAWRRWNRELAPPLWGVSRGS